MDFMCDIYLGFYLFVVSAQSHKVSATAASHYLIIIRNNLDSGYGASEMALWLKALSNMTEDFSNMTEDLSLPSAPCCTNRKMTLAGSTLKKKIVIQFLKKMINI